MGKLACRYSGATKHLLAPGLVDPGLSGELYARILFIMAKDATVEREAEMEKGANGRAARELLFAQPAKFLDLLWMLFGATLEKLPLSSIPDLKAAFKDRRVNCNHCQHRQADNQSMQPRAISQQTILGSLDSNLSWPSVGIF